MVIVSSPGRTLSLTASVLEDFKRLVRQHGGSVDAIIMNQNKGDTRLIVPGGTDPSSKFETRITFPVVGCFWHTKTHIVSMKNRNPSLHLTVFPGWCIPGERVTQPVNPQPQVRAFTQCCAEMTFTYWNHRSVFVWIGHWLWVPDMCIIQILLPKRWEIDPVPPVVPAQEEYAGNVRPGEAKQLTVE